MTQSQAAASIYYSEHMAEAGKAAYPALLREAIQRGTEQTLAQTLARSGYWKAYETRVRQGRPHQARVPHHAHPKVSRTAAGIAIRVDWQDDHQSGYTFHTQDIGM